MRNRHKGANPAHKNHPKSSPENRPAEKSQTRQSAGDAIRASNGYSTYVRSYPFISMGMAVAGGILLSRLYAE